MNAFRRAHPRILGPLLLALVACSGRSTQGSRSETSSGGAGGNSAGASGLAPSAGAGSDAAGTGGTGTSAGAGGKATGGGGAATGGDAATSGGASGSGGQTGFTLESSAFSEMGSMGRQYQCGATGKSPPLHWTGGPPGTQSYAVVMTGPDRAGAGNYYHWIIWDIPPTTSDLPEGVAQMAMPPEPAGSSQISPDVDGSTWPGYSGPCSERPDTPFAFTVFALDVAALPGVTSDSAGADTFAAIQAHMLESAELTGLSTRYRS